MSNSEPLRMHRFILNLPEELCVKYWMIKKIIKNTHHFNRENDHKLYVTINEYEDIGDVEAINWCEKFNALNLDEITYSDLDPTGVPVTEEHYTKPRISDISFSGSDYDDESIKTFEITLKYDLCYSEKNKGESN